MKTLNDFEEDLNKCSKCGLCETVCPLYKINPNDCVASKGKFIMLHGVTKGDLKLSDNIKKYLAKCLFCGKCNNFCPSGIDACKILAYAKNEAKCLNPIAKILQSKFVFNNFIKLGKLITKPFRPKRKKVDFAQKVLYFKGCINEICPKTDWYLHKIFSNQIEIVEPEFDCCGLPFLTTGNIRRFIETAKYNIKKFDTDYDYIVTDCSSCEHTLLQYSKYIENSKNITSSKFLNWGEIVASKNLKFKYEKNIKVTFHKPCHLKNDKFFEEIIENCKNVEYIKSDNYDECCGLAGSFVLHNAQLAKKLMSEKAQNIIKTGADYVITTCPLCVAGLKAGLYQKKSKIKVVSLLEFLSMAK